MFPEAPTGVRAPRTPGGFLEDAAAALRTVFGFAAFRPGQMRVLEALARGRDSLVIMPTGSGKSLCYQLPALSLPGTTLVISPLIALMKDQVDGLSARGVPVTAINSSLALDEQWKRIEGLRAGRYRLVYVAPERFRSAPFRRALAEAEIALLAVDEAHCISQWGHDFRPDYRRLRDIRRSLGTVQTIALTATATPEVQDDIVRELDMDGPERVVTGFDRPNLRFGVRRAQGRAAKLEILDAFIGAALQGRGAEGAPAGIVYTATRRNAEEVAEHLAAAARRRDPSGPAGPFARAYHAGLDDAERHEVQELFMEGRLPCVVSTNAFGMGVDKADIRYVVHFDLPGSVEAYYQEVGRAGRDGLSSDCLLLYSSKDRALQEFFIEGSNPGRETIESVHEFLHGLGENPIFRTIAELERIFSTRSPAGGRPNPMAFRSAVITLERAGALERLHHAGELAEVAPRAGADWTANPYGARSTVRRRLWDALQRVFERSDGGPASVSLETWARELELPSDALRRGLARLVDERWIRFTPPFRGRALRLPEKRTALDIDFGALREKRRRDEERLEKIVAFARGRRCRRDSILAYFGEQVPEAGCGTCDHCAPAAGPDRRARALTEEEVVVVRKVLSGVARARGRCGRRRLVQMLRGSRAEALTSSGLDKLSTYGILRDLGRSALREVVDLLEESGCLREEGNRYPVLRLTPLGVRVMKDELRIELPMAGPPRPAVPAENGRGKVPDGVTEDDQALFQRLRSLRRQLANDLGVPAYLIAGDRALRGMVRLRPSSEDELLAVPGVGAATLERFGRRFLAAIRGD